VAIILNTTFLLNGVLVMLMIVLAIALMDVINSYHKEKQMYGLTKSNPNRKDYIRNNRLLGNYNRTLKRFLSERKKEQYAPLIFYVTIGIAIALVGYFLSMKQVLFAVLAPITLIWVKTKIMSMLLIDVNDKVDEQLPYVIDTIIKVFSKYGDLKSVIYETSQSIEDPLRSKFEKLARKMLSENQEKAIMEFAEEMNNIWIYSLVFILLSYREETKKEEVIINLRHLSTIIEKENNLKNSSVTDKRYGVVLNYVIALIAFAGSIANLVFNPVAKTFFFGSMTGIICFTLGYASIIATIMLNIKLSSKKRRG
jgi:hypothetical protein